MNWTGGRAWWAEVRAIATRLAGRGASDAADDLVQDLALAALETGTTVERPGAWTERVARNAAIDSWRVQRRRDELACEIDGPTAPPHDPEALLLAREQRRAVRRALLHLPRPQRRAALLRFHGDLPFEHVAARLGTEPPTARTRVHRALRALRTRMQGLRVVLLGWHAAPATVLGLAIVATGVTAPPLRALPSVGSVGIGVAVRVADRRSSPPPPPTPTVTPTPTPTGTGVAPASAKPRPARGAPAASLPAPQVFVFDEDQIDVGVSGPDGEIIRVERPTFQPSLIELRRNFVPEVVKSLEEL